MTDDRHSRPRHRALIQLLRTAEDLWNASRVFFARWDVSPSQFNILNLLYGAPDGMSQSDLSRLLIMHRSNATGLVDRLEKRSLVRRESHPSDRRAYRVVITPAGADLLNQIYPHYFSASERVWSDLPDASVAQFLEQLQELAAHAAAVAVAETMHTDPPPSLPRAARSQRHRPTRIPLPTDAPRSPDAAVPDATENSLRTSDL